VPENEGICRLCRQHGQLTFEHVPPRSSFNDERTRVYGFPDWLNRDERGVMPGGRFEQRGAGAYALCERCNNNTGSWYGKELSRATAAGAGILAEAPLAEFDMLEEPRYACIDFKQSPTGPYPLRFIKQVITMLLATSPAELTQRQPELGDFVLDRTRTGLSEQFRLYLALFAGPNARSTGVASRIDLYRGRIDVLVEVAWPPFAYVMTIGSEPDAIETVDITEFVNVGYDQRADVHLDLLIGFGHMPYPADYRTRAMVERDRALDEAAARELGAA
jgi:hypothetical protein